MVYADSLAKGGGGVQQGLLPLEASLITTGTLQPLLASSLPLSLHSDSHLPLIPFFFFLPTLALYLNERGRRLLKGCATPTLDTALLSAFGVAAAGAEENAEGHFHIHLAGVSSFLLCTAAL